MNRNGWSRSRVAGVVAVRRCVASRAMAAVVECAMAGAARTEMSIFLRYRNLRSEA